MFPENLKKCRKIKEVTQKEVADFLEVTLGAYQRYEMGTREPNISTIIKLAEYFNTNTDYLLGLSDVRERRHKETNSNANDAP
jgi:transcriptional regulator with XRE-family HTH domain